MTSSAFVTPTTAIEPLWLAAISQADLALGSETTGQHRGDHQLEAHRLQWPGNLSVPNDLASQADKGQNIQLAPFSDRLKLRRQRYVPLSDRSPWQTLAPLFAGGQLETVAKGQWSQAPAERGQSPDVNHPEQWVLARLVKLEPSPVEGKAPSTASPTAVQLLPYLYIGLGQTGDLNLRLLPSCHHLGVELALSTLDGVGREFKISAQASFIQRIAQLQEMQLELGQEWTIRRSLYNSLAQAPLRPSQALRYFDRLLDESPYPPSRTPASDRLLQRRQLFKIFSTNPAHSLWNAYAAVAHWVNYAAPGNSSQRWHSCCHGPGATMLRQALAYAVALQYDQQEATETSRLPRISGAQRSLAASDALQTRIQQLRENEAIAQQPRNQLARPAD